MRDVRAAMITAPKVLPATATVRDLRSFFTDDHVHAALLCDGPRLVGIVTRADLDGAKNTSLDDPGLTVTALEGRTVGPEDDADRLLEEMVATGERRRAVVGSAGELLGLLCVKRSGTGFCSDADVAARAAERDDAAGSGGPAASGGGAR